MEIWKKMWVGVFFWTQCIFTIKCCTECTTSIAVVQTHNSLDKPQNRHKMQLSSYSHITGSQLSIFKHDVCHIFWKLWWHACAQLLKNAFYRAASVVTFCANVNVSDDACNTKHGKTVAASILQFRTNRTRSCMVKMAAETCSCPG